MLPWKQVWGPAAWAGRGKVFAAVWFSAHSPFACRCAGPGEGTCQADCVPAALPAPGLSAPARSVRVQSEALGDWRSGHDTGLGCHFPDAEESSGAEERHSWAHRASSLLAPLPADSSRSSSICSFTLPSAILPGAFPGCLLSLIRQMQSVGRPSPLAAKQPPLISARVYRIST